MAGRLRHLALLLAATLLLPLATSAQEVSETKVTNLQFYMHDVVGGPNATVARVAQPLNASADPTTPSSLFGFVYAIDDPLTVSTDRSSELIGRAQGMYAMTSLGDEFSLSMMLTYNFLAGPYNGSSFSVLGRNPVMREVREMPIVGGTGIFRLARGYCLAQTHSSEGFDAVIRYNVTLLHF